MRTYIYQPPTHGYLGSFNRFATSLDKLAKYIKDNGRNLPTYFTINQANVQMDKKTVFLMGGRSSLIEATAGYGHIAFTGNFNIWFTRFPFKFKTVTVICVSTLTNIIGVVPNEKNWQLSLKDQTNMTLPALVKRVVDHDNVLGVALAKAATGMDYW